jgi:hypothetical protein
MKTSRIEVDKNGRIMLVMKEGDCIMHRVSFEGTERVLAEETARNWERGSLGMITE